MTAAIILKYVIKKLKMMFIPSEILPRILNMYFPRIPSGLKVKVLSHKYTEFLTKIMQNKRFKRLQKRFKGDIKLLRSSRKVRTDTYYSSSWYFI
jgi:hypothetical protein